MSALRESAALRDATEKLALSDYALNYVSPETVIRVFFK